jgi:hypothetical protein
VPFGDGRCRISTDHILRIDYWRRMLQEKLRAGAHRTGAGG